MYYTMWYNMNYTNYNNIFLEGKKEPLKLTTSLQIIQMLKAQVKLFCEVVSNQIQSLENSGVHK